MNRLCPCGAIAQVGRPCPSCQRRWDAAKPSASERGYGYRAWDRGLRRRQLAREPMCQWHSSDGARCTSWATDVDHVVPKADGGADTLANLQSLCHGHHLQKTLAENAARAALRRDAAAADSTSVSRPRGMVRAHRRRHS